MNQQIQTTPPGSVHLPEIVRMYGAETLIAEMKNPTPELMAQIRAIQLALDASAAMDSVINGQLK